MPHEAEKRILDATFFDRHSLVCARELIGKELACGPCRGRILETEAYHEVGDPASHLFTRPSAREFARLHPPGTAYVYLNYGIHWLVNVLCRDRVTGLAGFVLFRALEPLAGIDEMKKRRATDDLRKLCSGPGKLTSALAIDARYHGRSLVAEADFALLHGEETADWPVVADRRIGISAGQELEWRFLARDHPGVSAKISRR